jgi:hypothetical protein
MHLLDNVVLDRVDLILALLLNQLALGVLNVGLESPTLHVRYIGLLFSLLNCALGVDLGVEDVFNLFMLFALVNLFVNIVLPGRLVLLNALLDVLALLPLLKFFIFVYHHVSHSVHQRLDPLPSFGHSLFTLTLLLLLLLNHFLNILRFDILASHFVCLALLFLFLIVLNHFHGSLSLLTLFYEFVLLFSFNLGFQFLGLHAALLKFVDQFNFAFLLSLL